MITEQQLKADCTSDIIKKMVGLAEGFEYQGDNEIFYNSLRVDRNIFLFPLLIHRAVEGFNKVDKSKNQMNILTTYSQSWNIISGLKSYEFSNYQPESLTPGECACLHCLIEVLK